eukprot:363564-Chlamydomonas_euryale.AAC.12
MDKRAFGREGNMDKRAFGREGNMDNSTLNDAGMSAKASEERSKVHPSNPPKPKNLPERQAHGNVGVLRTTSHVCKQGEHDGEHAYQP